MTKRIRCVFKGFPWYVLLFLLYPPLNLLGQNIGEVDYSAANRAIAVLLIFGIPIVFLIQLILRDWQKTGVLFTLLSILFFSYGRVLNYFASLETAMSIMGRHRYMVIGWGFLALTCIIWAVRTKLNLDVWGTALKTISVVLIVFPVIQLSLFSLKDWTASRSADRLTTTSELQAVPATSELPDVYYIILDAYGRSDILQQDLDFDNAEFINDLKSLGFYVADCAQSNYAKTAMSLASSLNMNYLQDLSTEGLAFDNRFSPAWAQIRNNAVMGEFQRLGYKTVAFETGYSWTEFKEVDVYLAPPDGAAIGFESLLLRTSALLILDDFGWLDRLNLTPEAQKHARILYVLDQLDGSVPKIDGPKFVFVHLVIPHQPFVVGPNGELSVVAKYTLDDEAYYLRDDYVLGYTNQAAFIGNNFPHVLESIIHQSSNPPIIVVQGDHGPAGSKPKFRMPILNAYYFPGTDVTFYPKITPVNTFRMIFNTYLDANMPILEDHSYFSENDNVYNFQDAPNNCESTQ